MNVFSTFSVFSVEPPKTEFQAGIELKALGMSADIINGLFNLHNEFPREKVSDDKKATDRYIEEFRIKTDNFIYTMNPKDREIYDNYLKKYELDK